MKMNIRRGSNNTDVSVGPTGQRVNSDQNKELIFTIYEKASI